MKPLDYRQHKILYHSLKKDKGLTVNIEFEDDRLKEEYFLGYYGIYTEISQMTRFVESTDLSTAYLDRIDMTRHDNQNRGKIPNFWTRYTSAKLLINT